MRTKTLLPLLIAFIALPALSTEAAITMYLDVMGVNGEATEATHQGWMVVDSFSWGVSQAI